MHNTKLYCIDNNEYLTNEIREVFKISYKNGIYKELHRRKLLSDSQLNLLLKSNK